MMLATKGGWNMVSSVRTSFADRSVVCLLCGASHNIAREKQTRYLVDAERVIPSVAGVDILACFHYLSMPSHPIAIRAAS